ncbi:MAG: carbonic anhydrase [Rhodospirillales bacterium]
MAGGAALSGAGLLSPLRRARADDTPVNDLDGKAALEKLRVGNARFVKSKGNLAELLGDNPVLTAGQAPFATILSCSDSRVVPEILFDQSQGSLFVVRVAGNILTTDGLASIEYAVKVLGSKLIMVLGHEACGAVAAAIEVVENGLVLPGHLPQLVRSIEPAVMAAKSESGALLDDSIDWNVKLVREQLGRAGPVVSAAVASGQVMLAGGVFDLDSGVVEFLV